jgi:hypothetical protein
MRADFKNSVQAADQVAAILPRIVEIEINPPGVYAKGALALTC